MQLSCDGLLTFNLSSPRCKVGRSFVLVLIQICPSCSHSVLLFACILVQALYRGMRVRRRLTREKTAATVLQRAWRVCLQKRRIDVALERGRSLAATTIQVWWRTAATNHRSKTPDPVPSPPPVAAAVVQQLQQPVEPLQRPKLSAAAAAAVAAAQQRLSAADTSSSRPATLEERLRMVRERQRQILNKFQQEKQQQMILTHLVSSESSEIADAGPHGAVVSQQTESPLLASSLSSPHPPRPRPPPLERRGRCNLFELGLPRIADDDGCTWSLVLSFLV